MYCRQESFLERKLELEGSYTALTQYLANLWNFWIPNLFLWSNTFRYPGIGDWVLSHGNKYQYFICIILANFSKSWIHNLFSWKFWKHTFMYFVNGDWVLSHGYKYRYFICIIDKQSSLQHKLELDGLFFFFVLLTRN